MAAFTPEQLVRHPVYAHFRQRLDFCVNNLLQTGQMTPQEASIIQTMMQQAGPGTLNFIGGIMTRYASIDDAGMDAEINTNFLPSIRQVAQQRLTAGAGLMYGSPMVQPGYGVPMAGTTWRTPMTPYMQPAPGVVVQPRPMFTPGTGHPGSMFQQVAPPPAPTPASHQQQQPQQPAPKPADRIPYKQPEPVSSTYDTTVCGCVKVRMDKYARFDGSSIYRVAVHDPRIRYSNDQEALNAYKGIFAGVKKPEDHKFLTVIYKQLKALPVDKQEFHKLASAVAAEVLKAGQSLETKLRAVVSTLQKVSVQQAAVTEFQKLVLEEFDSHLRAGALCDSCHPEAIVSCPSSVQGLLDLYVGDIDKNMLHALRSMPGFQETLERILNTIVDTMIKQLPQYILDPTRDRTIIDDISRVIPQVWSPDEGASLRGTDDIFEIFLKSRETIGDSKTDSAVKAESDLAAKTAELSKHFTLVYVHRVASWCNYAKSEAVHYKSNGNCQPYVADPNSVNNDLAYFCVEVLRAAQSTKMASSFRTSPHTVYCEIDEETFMLDYDWTTDGKLWLGISRFWHA